MNKKTILILMACLPSLLATTKSLAQHPDSPGSEDHPMVTRYEGSFIDGYEIKEFDEFILPLGPAVRNDDGVKVPKEQAVLEGRITRVLYRGPDERSSLEILRNYQSALESAGFETLYNCAGKDCGFLFHWVFYHEREQRILSTKTSGGAFDIPQDLRYLSAKGVAGGRTVHVSVLVAFDGGFSKLSKQPVTLLEVIESEAMDTGMVTIDAEAMAKGIDATSTVAGRDAALELDFDDILGELDAAFAIHFEAKQGALTLFAEYNYAKLDPTIEQSVGPITIKADIDFKDTLWEMGATYVFAESDTTRWEVLGGVRYMDIDYDNRKSGPDGYGYDGDEQGPLLGMSFYF